ncbi:MAG: class I SAM-dependent methyltransferase [Bacteroidales bacterium]
MMQILNEATVDFVLDNVNVDVNQLLLRKNIPAQVDLKMAAQQIEARQKYKKKLPSFCANPLYIFPPRLAMEQCSSEETACYKAQLLVDKSVVDLTGGLGIDSFYIAQTAKQVLHIEQDRDLQAITNANFISLGAKNITSIAQNSIDFLKKTTRKFDAIYIDPARRDAQRNKVIRLADCKPNVIEWQDLLFEKAQQVILKASPMLDIAQAIRELKYVSEVHIVAIKNECKELLFVCKKDAETPKIHCVELHANSQQNFTFDKHEEHIAENLIAKNVGAYIYEPHVSLLKAGAFKFPCHIFSVAQLHSDSHLYTSEHQQKQFFGKIFAVKAVFSLNEKNIKEYLPLRKANVVVRNFPISVEQIRRKYKIDDGGDIFLFATTLHNGERKIIQAQRIA